jgi:type VI protein secretion system component VasK
MAQGVAVSLLWITVAVLALIIAAISIVDIVRRHLGFERTVAWLLIVLVLPFVGSVLYWALRKPSPDEVTRIADAERSRRDEARQQPFDSTGLR